MTITPMTTGGTARKLMLCAGAMEREGWMRLDADSRTRPDYHAILPPLPEAVRAIQWEQIEWMHGITSGFDLWEGKQLLRQLYEVLAPGGKLILEQPDIEKAMRAALDDPSKLYWVYGNPAPHNPLHTNRWGYTPKTLTDALVDAGFVRTRIDLLSAQYHRPERDFRLEAIK